ncbi:ferrous iron transport protein A [Chloroflexota bacterium]
MPDRKQIALSKIGAGQSGRVIEIQGGQNIISRLNALNVRLGQRITKVNSMLMHGPVTIKVGTARVAIGYGMAKRIIVELQG